MPDFRAFCAPSTAEPSEIVLSPEESHHLIAVNRARTGDTVVAFDGRGSEWICELTDRKSTRLNSSHRCISYAVFCLKKKKHHMINELTAHSIIIAINHTLHCSC